MKKTSKHPDVSGPQSVAPFIKLHNGEETIKIGFTDQKISPHAGLASFIAFLHWHRLKDLLARVMPQRTSPNATPSADLAVGFMLGILAGAKKLAHCAHLRADRVLPGLLGIERLGSQSALSRFLQCFRSAQMNTKCFEALWRWALERLTTRPGVTRWIWIPPACCMRTLYRREACARGIPSTASSAVFTRYWA